jgi:hypothetical protein
MYAFERFTLVHPHQWQPGFRRPGRPFSDREYALGFTHVKYEGVSTQQSLLLSGFTSRWVDRDFPSRLPRGTRSRTRRDLTDESGLANRAKKALSHRYGGFLSCQATSSFGS